MLIVGSIQISAVYLLRVLQPDLTAADLVSIMPAAKERIAAGCMIAADPGAAHLILMNNSPKELRHNVRQITDHPHSC
jgi:hypothetical protein